MKKNIETSEFLNSDLSFVEEKNFGVLGWTDPFEDFKCLIMLMPLEDLIDISDIDFSDT